MKNSENHWKLILKKCVLRCFVLSCGLFVVGCSVLGSIFRGNEDPPIPRAISEANAMDNPVTAESLQKIRAEHPFTVWATPDSYENDELCITVQFAHYFSRESIRNSRPLLKGINSAEEASKTGIVARPIQILGPIGDNLDTRICFEQISNELTATTRYLLIDFQNPEREIYLVWELIN